MLNSTGTTNVGIFAISRQQIARRVMRSFDQNRTGPYQLLHKVASELSSI